MLSGTHENGRQERVTFGRPAAEVLAERTAALNARRVFIVTGRSMAVTPFMAGIRSALGERFAGMFDGCRAHSPREDVIAGSAAAREAGADLLVGIGGGSAIDAAKVMQLCLWNGIIAPAGLDAFRGRRAAGGREGSIRMIAISTTLSGAEYTSIAGVTDAERGAKDVFDDPLLIPREAVLDPAATMHTPGWLLHSTGVRAVDHGIEAWCSTGRTPYSDALAVESLRMLLEALPRLKDVPDDLDNRLTCQLGVWLSIMPLASGVPVGASHAIGRVLGGSFGVPHGRTSCILLAPTLAWNAAVNGERQRRLNEMIAGDGATLSATVASLVGRLGEPRRLRDVGFARSDLDALAEKSMAMLQHPSTSGNPRPVTGAADVLDILERAW
jgi:maleylacetate reductase